jgi:serine/threonine-protein kinase
VGVLAIQLAHGGAYLMEGHPYPPQGFTSFVVWEQAILILAVVLATLTSRVIYGLRMKFFKAAALGRYSVEGRIGGGAVGEVFRAHHALIRRPVAVKVLRPEIAGEKNLERFEKEVQRTSRLTHPNTVSIYDYGLTTDGLFFYAMEYLDGADLDRVVEMAGPLPASRVLHILQQVCGALEEAHSRGLVHCDLKPANLMLCRQGGRSDVVKVLDFGLARNVAQKDEDEQGVAFGTPLTMAPEVIRGAELGPATDLYALGAVGYFLATGSPPFGGRTVGEVLAQHLTQEPDPPSERDPAVPRDLEACLLHCLKKDPADRPDSAGALLAAMERRADAGRWTRLDAERWWATHATSPG